MSETMALHTLQVRFTYLYISLSLSGVLPDNDLKDQTLCYVDNLNTRRQFFKFSLQSATPFITILFLEPLVHAFHAESRTLKYRELT